MGLFVYTQKGSIISMVDLPTTEIIEPEKLTSRENELRSLFLYVQSNQNPFFKVFKVPETKGISLNDFDEIVGSFQFGVRIR